MRLYILQNAIKSPPTSTYWGIMGLGLTRRIFGLCWKTSTPPIPWREIIEAALLITVVASAYLLVGYNDANTRLKASQERAQRSAIHAEKVLVGCLNKKPLLGDDGSVVMCDTYYIQAARS